MWRLACEFPRKYTSEKEVLAEEIIAQIKKCRNMGIPITHIDSHYHVHVEWGIAALLIPIAQKQGIPYIRIARNCGLGISSLKRVYKYWLNYKIKAAGLTRTKYFGSIEDFVFLRRQLGLSVAISFEVMIHPKFNEKGILVDNTNDIPLKDAIKHIDPHKKAMSFSGAKYTGGNFYEL